MQFPKGKLLGSVSRLTIRCFSLATAPPSGPLAGRCLRQLSETREVLQGTCGGNERKTVHKLQSSKDKRERNDDRNDEQRKEHWLFGMVFQIL